MLSAATRSAQVARVPRLWHGWRHSRAGRGTGASRPTRPLGLPARPEPGAGARSQSPQPGARSPQPAAAAQCRTDPDRPGRVRLSDEESGNDLCDFLSTSVSSSVSSSRRVEHSAVGHNDESRGAPAPANGTASWSPAVCSPVDSPLFHFNSTPDSIVGRRQQSRGTRPRPGPVALSAGSPRPSPLRHHLSAGRGREGRGGGEREDIRWPIAERAGRELDRSGVTGARERPEWAAHSAQCAVQRKQGDAGAKPARVQRQRPRERPRRGRETESAAGPTHSALRETLTLLFPEYEE